MASMRRPSVASSVFVALVAGSLALVTFLAIALVVDARDATRAEAEAVTASVAATIAHTPGLAATLTAAEPEQALAEAIERMRQAAGVDFVTVMRPGGTRVTHPDPSRVGGQYLGTIPETPTSLTEQFTGTLGPSVRTIVPIEGVPIEGDSGLVGWVSVGVTVGSIEGDLARRMPVIAAVALALALAGVALAMLARRQARGLTGDLRAREVRDAVSSYESLRTLGDALRAQSHEHGNRMHTTLALLELGRVDEAKDLLASTSGEQQRLIDVVTAREGGDATIAALLLGKSAEARERGIDWSLLYAPDAPRGRLSATEAVAVVGNLVDNAMDAAGAGPAPRAVAVSFTREPDGWLRLEVRDSGNGVPAELRERIFEHGFSTKPARPGGRGVGLALVRGVVEAAGGSLQVPNDPPSRFIARIPPQAAP